MVERRTEAVQEGDGAQPRAGGCERVGGPGDARGSGQQPLDLIRRPLQDGQTPRPLQENATTNAWPQPVHRARANPQQRMPHSR